MGLTILTNVAALSAQRNLNNTQTQLSATLGKLSSGMRIVSAADDAAGLGISENLKANIRSLSQAQRNANDGISESQVAEGSMNEMQGIVSRMRELAVQSANGTLGSTERSYVQTEFVQLRSEIDRISSTTEFNGQKLLDGSASTGLTMQVGIRNTTNDRLAFSITKLNSSTLGSTLKIGAASLSTTTNAQAAIAVFDKAIQQLSNARSKVGATQNRLISTVNNLAVTTENLSAANSRIRDVDVATETANMSRYQILTQAGVAVMSQANQMPQSALSLLR
jgi:flagellin